MLTDNEARKKLNALGNEKAAEIVETYAKLCRPESVKVITDSAGDAEYVRTAALKNREEKALSTAGHTVHFDGYNDQGRDKENTKVLANSTDRATREAAIEEVMELLKGIMAGKEMLVRFFCLGPQNSPFTLRAMQITDSAYVSHSESLLYRNGYESFRNMKDKDDFFHFVHAAGALKHGVSANTDKRRIYIDLEENRAFSVNTQYAGNSIGLKKLALRLAIKKAHNEGWLCGHMFIMGVNRKKRTTYFLGAFPSACGKTSTAMLPGHSIVGDDISYIRRMNGAARAVNPESGIFGIIQDVNPADDPLIYRVLTTPRELVFSNVLVNSGKAYWLGMGPDMPAAGINHSGEWFSGKKDKDGKEIAACHKNARYALRLSELANADKNTDNGQGVEVGGIIYGGRDSDTMPPVVESFDWRHGTLLAACVESESTAATLGKEGVVKHDAMAIMDFLPIPLGDYINDHLSFGSRLEKKPKIFSVNYFLKENGIYMNEKTDKKIWLMWMEGRVHNEFNALATPIGLMPRHEDLEKLFSEVSGKDYTEKDYEKQFSLRIQRLLEKFGRMEKIFAAENIPAELLDELKKQRTRLDEAAQKYRNGVISPFEFYG